MEELINRIINSMDDLTVEQVRKLENVLIIHLSEYLNKGTEISTAPRDWEQIINHFLGCKKLENCADGTLRNYQRILRFMYSSIGKDIRDVTGNDLRYFMAMYIEKRHISLQYSENIRHTLNGFFQWVQSDIFQLVMPKVQQG